MAQAVIGPEERTALFRWSRWLQVADIVYNLFEMGAAILFGLAAGSIALIGFGLDSGIEVSAAAIILWRLRVEGQDEAESRTERRAELIVGLTLMALAVFIVVQAGRSLLAQQAADPSLPGIVLSVLSLLFMPLFFIFKRRVADRLGSRALAAGATEQIVCSYLAFALLLGLGANTLFGWWWADPTAALAMVPLVVREGWEAIRGEDGDGPNAEAMAGV
ncbi:MAG TPA: cation transporter [Dehalococcoidia bacterium]|nr:cation transporter [Dehalococcoidia bacterium]